MRTVKVEDVDDLRTVDGLGVVDWKDGPEEVLRLVDEMIADRGLEVVLHDDASDSVIWTIEARQ